tara:strand:+ start:11195 stop:11422 length:228 start_codon:yes stop_codon:yes gene_type:complete
MGNIFIKKIKKKNNDNKDLYKSLIGTNINEKIIYLETKLDNLDNDFYVFQENTKANIFIMSKDIHILYDRIPPPK